MLFLGVLSGCSLVGDCHKSASKSEGKCTKCGTSECSCSAADTCDKCSNEKEDKKSCH